MKIRVAQMLLVLMTLTGVIMPIHAFAHELIESTDAYSLERGVAHDSNNESDACDHCCHFSSHSIGIIRVVFLSGYEEINEVRNFQKQEYPSIKEPPPYHPPIA